MLERELPACVHEGCHLRDFLHSSCNICEGIYCKEHIQITDHNCIGPEESFRTECLLCADGVYYNARTGEKEAAKENALAAHMRKYDCINTCDRRMEAKLKVEKKKKKKCPAAGCKDPLLVGLTTTCEHCKQQTCLTHRWRDSHTCEIPKQRKKKLLGLTIPKFSFRGLH